MTEILDILISINNGESNFDTELEKLDEKISELIKQKNELKDFRDFPKKMEFINSDYYEKLKFYIKMEKAICSNERGLKFWNDLKKNINHEYD